MHKQAIHFLRSPRGVAAALLFLACLTALLFNIRHLILFADTARHGQVYTHFSFLGPDWLANLAPMVRDGLDGHWFPADGRLAEHVDDPNVWGPVVAVVHAPLLWMMPQVPGAMLLGRLLAVFFAYLMCYALLARIFRRRWPALFGGMVFLLAPLLWSRLLPLSGEDLRVIGRSLLPLGSLPGEILLSKYDSLSIYPALPLVCVGLWLLLRVLETRRRPFSLSLGLVLGALATVYITHAIYLGAICVLACGILLLRRTPGMLAATVYVAAGAACTGLPFAWNYIHLRQSPFVAELYLRLGGDMTHAFRWSEWYVYAVYGVAALGVYVLAKRRGRPELGALLAAGILSAIAVLNLQVILGYNPAPTVWRLHQIFFGFFLAGSYVVWETCLWVRSRVGRSYAWCVPVVVVGLGCMIMLRAVSADVFAVSYTRGMVGLPPAHAQAVAWLNTHTPKDSVVVSPSLATNTLLPTFTHNRVLLGKAIASAAPEWELLDRLFVSYVLFGVPPEHLEAGLQKRVALTDPFFHTVENDLVTYLFEYRFVSAELDAFYTGASRAVPDAVVAELVERYKHYPRRLEYLLNRYQMDYLFVGPMERQIMHADVSSLPYLIMVYNQDGIQIYKIDRNRI